MNTPTRRYRGDTLRTCVLAFFETNPHEELTFDDMLVKFDASVSNLELVLGELKRERLIERARVYRRPQRLADSSNAHSQQLLDAHRAAERAEFERECGGA